MSHASDGIRDADAAAAARKAADDLAARLRDSRPPSRGRQPLDGGITLAALMQTDLPDPEYVVEGLLPVGLTILAARPKAGKSWLALQLAIAVAQGETVLGSVPTHKLPVLYLALEDTRRRLKKRSRQLLDALGWEAPEGLDLRVAWPRSGAGGLADIAEWLSEHPGGLVIVDTLARFRDPPKGRGNSYLEDYEAVAELKRIADLYHGAIVIIHHTRKGVADDPFDEVSGTLGINGAADSLLVLDRIRGQDAGTLYLTGRDLADETITLGWQDSGVWTLTGRSDGIERLERPQAPTRAEKCADWLREYMTGYAWPDRDLEAAATSAGYTASQLRRAKEAMRRSDPPLASKKRGFGGVWWNWIGDESDPPPDRPEQPTDRNDKNDKNGDFQGKRHSEATILDSENGEYGSDDTSKTPGKHHSRHSRHSRQRDEQSVEATEDRIHNRAAEQRRPQQSCDDLDAIFH